MPKKLPYGQSNFANLIESGYAYVDKTRYVELLENENNTYQFLIRPRRFGFGMLTINGIRRGQTCLKSPNYYVKTLLKGLL
jgi:hypothetical protein